MKLTNCLNELKIFHYLIIIVINLEIDYVLLLFLPLYLMMGRTFAKCQFSRILKEIIHLELKENRVMK